MKGKLQTLYLYVDREEDSSVGVEYRWAMNNVKEMLVKLFPEEAKEFKRSQKEDK